MKALDLYFLHPGALAADGPAKAGPLSTRLAYCCSLAVLTALTACGAAPPAQIPPSNASLPEPLRVGNDEVLQDIFTASGVQTYTCRHTADGLSWRESGVESSLFDAAQLEVGAIAPGDYFTAHDDSIFAGRVADEVEMTPVTLPWQRIVRRYIGGSPAGDGRLSNVTSIQRVLTSGGVPVERACGIDGQSLLVPYAATYLFYRHAHPAMEAGGAGEAVSAPVPNPSVATTPSR